MITLGARYAIAIILPIVGTFFLSFSVIEDSGYLLRLAMLIDRVFKKIGLNGWAVIPMVLGFGCDTMATIVTRTLETRRERVLSTILLLLPIPCSAQLGVMLGMLSGRLVIRVGRLTGVFDLAVSALEPLVHWLGLPDQTAVAFLFGFFRRDYGAAGLYDLRNNMTGAQILVSTVTMTLFVPCVAQFSVTLKERGWKTALAIFVFIFPFAFLIGGLLNWLLMDMGVRL